MALVTTTKTKAAALLGDLDAAEVLLSFYRHHRQETDLAEVEAATMAVVVDISAEAAGRRAAQILADHARSSNAELYRSVVDASITQAELAWERGAEVDEWQVLAASLANDPFYGQTSRG